MAILGQLPGDAGGDMIPLVGHAIGDFLTWRREATLFLELPLRALE